MLAYNYYRVWDPEGPGRFIALAHTFADVHGRLVTNCLVFLVKSASAMSEDALLAIINGTSGGPNDPLSLRKPHINIVSRHLCSESRGQKGYQRKEPFISLCIVYSKSLVVATIFWITGCKQLTSYLDQCFYDFKHEGPTNILTRHITWCWLAFDMCIKPVKTHPTHCFWLGRIRWFCFDFGR